MTDPRSTSEASAEGLEQMLTARVDIAGIASETDPEKVNAVVFELYKEALSILNAAAHLLDEEASVEGGWPRNQAICAGLMIRIAKFMLVVTQLSAKGDRAEVVAVLNRSIMESAINLEFLVSKNDARYFDQFVRLSLVPERELYDMIHANIAARAGRTWPIEERMLKSINDVCQASGIKIEEVNRRSGDWGGGLRERLKALSKEEQYVGMQRMPSHAVHGTWVDLYTNHLQHDFKNDVFSPDSKFSWVDARSLGPIAVFVLEASKVYLERFFSGISETRLLLDRIEDLHDRILEADAVHERLMTKLE